MSKKVSVRLDDRMYEILEAISYISGQSMSEVLRQGLRQLYKNTYTTLICPKCRKPYERIEQHGTLILGVCENCNERRRVGTWPSLW